MIGFKVVDTQTGELVNPQDYVVNSAGYMFKLSFENEEMGTCNGCHCPISTYKAVPSITIDGVEYYHGMVCRLKSSIEYIIAFGKFTISAGVFSSTTYGWHVVCSNNNSTLPLMPKGLTEIGNVWQPEHRHLLLLWEV